MKKSNSTGHDIASIKVYMGEIYESGFIEKIGNFFWDFESLFWQLMKRYSKK